jgi:ABC-type phosphate/phosphonate transport system permease subunit
MLNTSFHRDAFQTVAAIFLFIIDIVLIVESASGDLREAWQ